MAKWCIDYGHGGADSGACNGSRQEKNDVVKVGEKVVEYLKHNGQTVVLSRQGDVYVKPYDRAVYSNNQKADYFISLHRNSSNNPEGNGLETFAEKGAVKGKKLAQAIQKELLAVVPYRDRGYKEENFTVLANTNMPSVLTELGFISNANDNKLFDENIENMAHAIAKACIEYVGGSYKRKGTNTSTATNNASTGEKTMYRVVCGSFESKATAQKRADEVKAKTGYDCFLVATKI